MKWKIIIFVRLFSSKGKFSFLNIVPEFRYSTADGDWKTRRWFYLWTGNQTVGLLNTNW